MQYNCQCCKFIAGATCEGIVFPRVARSFGNELYGAGQKERVLSLEELPSHEVVNMFEDGPLLAPSQPEAKRFGVLLSWLRGPLQLYCKVTASLQRAQAPVCTELLGILKCDHTHGLTFEGSRDLTSTGARVAPSAGLGEVQQASALCGNLAASHYSRWRTLQCVW